MSSVNFETLDFDDMTLVYARFLRFIAILPFENRDYTSPITRVLLVVNLAASCINWSMFICYTISEGVPSIDSICETVVVVGFNLRFYLLLWHRREIADLISEGRRIWKDCDEEGRRAVWQFEGKVRVLFLAILGNMMFAHLLYSVTAVVLTLQAKTHLSNDSQRANHFLPYKWYAVGTEDVWPGYEFNFAIQVVIIALVSTMASTVDSAAPLLIMLGAGFFRDLQGQLRRTGDEDSCIEQNFVSCLRRHQRILSYCSRIDDVTQTLFFVQLLTTGYNSSLVGIKLVGTDPDKYKYLTVGIFNLAQLFICQWAPDHLIDESKAIATAAYDASYSWLKRRKGKFLLIMIARAQRPVQLTAAGLFYMSLENFGSMLKGAISLFTMLRNFNI